MKKIFNKIKRFVRNNKLLNDISNTIVYVVDTIVDFYKKPEEEPCIIYAEGFYSNKCKGYAEGYKPKDPVHNDVYLTVRNEGNHELLEYNIKNQLLHAKRFDGYERWFIYDTKGNLIYYKTSANFESWRTYDEKGNCITYKNSHGHNNRFIYNERGIVIDMIDITDMNEV